MIKVGHAELSKPKTVINASDGVGNWTIGEHGSLQVVFRKLLFNGARQNFADLHVTGTVLANGVNLQAQWQIEVVDLTGVVIVDLGAATSQGVRIS